jgi:hypothetical protein
MVLGNHQVTRPNEPCCNLTSSPATDKSCEQPCGSTTAAAPRDVLRDRENPALLAPPVTDSGTMITLRLSYRLTRQEAIGTAGGTVKIVPVKYRRRQRPTEQSGEPTLHIDRPRLADAAGHGH